MRTRRPRLLPTEALPLIYLAACCVLAIVGGFAPSNHWIWQ